MNKSKVNSESNPPCNDALLSTRKVMAIDELRNKLKVFVLYEDGLKIRKEIRSLAIETYVQKYTDTEHMGFLKRHEISTKVQHAQSENHPYYYGMFSVCTQHIMADTIEELLDMALDIESKESNVVCDHPEDQLRTMTNGYATYCRKCDMFV